MTALLSAQVVTVNAGTAVSLSSAHVWGTILIKALDTNTGVVVIGNDAADDVTVSNGYRLAAGDVAIVETGDLGDLYLDSAVNGEGVSWLKINS